MAKERIQRRLAAILTADVVGYSRPMGTDEEEALSQLNALRSKLLHPRSKNMAAAPSRPLAMGP